MESRLINRGNRWCLEVEADSTGVDRAEVARLLLDLHGLREGQVEVVFTNASTQEN